MKCLLLLFGSPSSFVLILLFFENGKGGEMDARLLTSPDCTVSIEYCVKRHQPFLQQAPKPAVPRVPKVVKVPMRRASNVDVGVA